MKRTTCLFLPSHVHAEGVKGKRCCLRWLPKILAAETKKMQEEKKDFCTIYLVGDGRQAVHLLENRKCIFWQFLFDSYGIIRVSLHDRHFICYFLFCELFKKVNLIFRKTYTSCYLIQFA